MLPSHIPKSLSLHSLTFILLFFIVCPSRIKAWTCESSCAGIPLNYPFGSGWDCGSSSFQPYVNCTHNNQLLFYTPTGTYTVQSIDYINNIMIVVDPRMSTCSAMGSSGAVGLPIESPFSFSTYNTIALIGCSSTASLYNKGTCDASQQQVCASLCDCAAISQSEITPNSPSSSCCVLSSSVLATPPYEIDLPLLQCASYSSIYHIGSMGNPQSSWLFGIALSFNNPGSSPYTPPFNGQNPSPPSHGQNPNCYVCQEAEEAKASLLGVSSFLLWAIGLILLMQASPFLI